MGDKIIITEGETLEIKIMIGIGVGHMKGRRDHRSISNSGLRSYSRANINRNRLDVSNVGNITTSQETVQQLRQTEKQNKFNRCSI